MNFRDGKLEINVKQFSYPTDIIVKKYFKLNNL